jgi:dienelactone hydrolase
MIRRPAWRLELFTAIAAALVACRAPARPSEPPPLPAAQPGPTTERSPVAKTGPAAEPAPATEPAPAAEAPRAPARPQEPRPPFPYTEREVALDAPEAGRLAGTLTIPPGKAPFPAVVLISGSGQQDRDETIFGHRPFRLLADRLARAGFVVLRTDDRGTGQTTGALGTLETDVGDARAAFEWLGQQPEVDRQRIGLLGHSVGGLIAPTIAARTRKVAFIVALAGPGVTGVELIAAQVEALLTASKVPAAAAKQIADVQRKVGAAIAKGDPARIRATLRESLVDSARALGRPVPDDATLDRLVDAKLPETANPWVVSLFRSDAPALWRQVKCPVLAIIGDKDLQVPADSNLAGLTAALAAGGNKDVTAKKQPGLNHLYQHATTGLVDEYGTIEETFDPATLDLIAAWMTEKMTAKAKPR